MPLPLMGFRAWAQFFLGLNEQGQESREGLSSQEAMSCSALGWRGQRLWGREALPGALALSTGNHGW